MKVVHWMALIAVIAFVLPAQAQNRTRGPAVSAPAPAAVGDAEIILYRISGVRDDGSNPDAGVATAFHCTNFSGVTETIRIVIRDFDATLLGNTAFNINHLETKTAVTHPTVAYIEDETLLPVGIAVEQGSAAIAATSRNITCTAMTVDAASASPVGVSLQGIRFSPAPGT
jgi:hypothetical protein